MMPISERHNVNGTITMVTSYNNYNIARALEHAKPIHGLCSRAAAVNLFHYLGPRIRYASVVDGPDRHERRTNARVPL